MRMWEHALAIFFLRHLGSEIYGVGVRGTGVLVRVFEAAAVFNWLSKGSLRGIGHQPRSLSLKF